MGNSLYNKIHLGRHPVFGSRRMQAAWLVGALVSMAMVWFALRTFK